MIVKLMHAAITEKKDPKLKIERRLMQYHNTSHPSTGKTPSEIMFNMVVHTRLPTVKKVTVAVQEKREKDQQERAQEEGDEG